MNTSEPETRPGAEQSSPAPQPPAAPDSGKYLYAFVSAQHVRQSYDGLGLNGGPTYAIVEGPLAAIVSDVPNKKIRPERRVLAAHQAVLRLLMEDATPLPVSFGTIASDADDVRRILQANQAAFVEQLRRVDGKAEMGIKATWNVPNIFEYFVSVNDRLRALRDELYRGGREPSQADKIELGRAFDHALTEERARHMATVSLVLGPLCADIKANDPRDEREVFCLACLVPRDAQSDFEAGIFEAARLFDNNYSFDYNGPWPPYNFVTGAFQVQE